MSDTADPLKSSTTLVGTAEVFLRPLRFLFDIETELTVAAARGRDDKDDALGLAIHVHLAISTRPPLIERQQPNGFLRAHRAGYEFDDHHNEDNDDNDDGVDNDSKTTPSHAHRSSAKDTSDEELSALTGTFVWLLVRMQHQSDSSTFVPLQSSAHKRERHNMHVQYQLTPATESFCLPIDHTNVIKLLVSHDLLHHVDTKTLVFHFLLLPVEAKAVETNASVSVSPLVAPASDTKDALAESSTTSAIADALVTHTAAHTAALACIHEQTRQRERALEQEHERERAQLERELVQRTAQSEQLAAELESQQRGKRELAASVGHTTQQTEQAIELLKQRMARDANERDELQRRLQALEDEKLALLRKSRACVLQ